MSTTITFGGNDLSDTPFQFAVVDVTKPLMASPHHEATDFGMMDGEYLAGGALRGVSFRATLSTMATSESGLRARLDALRAILNTRTDQKLTCSLWPDRYWMARPTGSFPVEPLGLNGCVLEIEFRASDPLAFGATERSQNHSIGSDDQMITVAKSSLANGTALVRPVITVTCPASKTLFKFYNQETQQTMLYVCTAPAGAKVKFDSLQHLIRYSTDGGDTWITRMAGKKGPFITLLPQVENNIRVEHLSGTSINIAFRERYTG